VKIDAPAEELQKPEGKGSSEMWGYGGGPQRGQLIEQGRDCLPQLGFGYAGGGS
jgi:hypothetical protein